jgi:cyclic beta-1,2-glucan synthetase
MAITDDTTVHNEELVPHSTVPDIEIPIEGLPEAPSVSEEVLRASASALVGRWQLLPKGTPGRALELRLKALSERLKGRLAAAKEIADLKVLTPQLELLESSRMFEAAIESATAAKDTFAALPRIQLPDGSELPRLVNLAEGYLASARGIWSSESLQAFTGEAQRLDPLLLEEVRLLPQALKIAQLEYILDRADETFAAGTMPSIEQSPFSAPIHSLRRLNQYEWRKLLESILVFDAVLRQDPTGVFARMEDETRATYHERVATLAARSDKTELETATEALVLAARASSRKGRDPKQARRESHIGYYLFAEGLSGLRKQISYHAPFKQAFRDTLRQYNEDFYILGIFTLSLLLIVALIAPLVPHHNFGAVIFALLFALLPASQGGVDLINSTVSALLHAEALPKLDFSKGIPDNARALVIVPTLLLNEPQVRDLFEELEARYLSNEDPNLHFGLLTDLADSAARPFDEDKNLLVDLAIRMIEDLNEKYARERGGKFILLHRHRVFNARQGVWMGWERKRGKLLDLNKFLLNVEDAFPIKAGPIDVLHNTRYVITLDSDTQLPRGTAARMVGTLAHPLNQAIVDPQSRIVTAGYGILQPRVGVSVSSASRSRLAALYSGETGFDIYTRAVSDVYQDLFGEGIFAGKGIYDVPVLHQVLDRRFPRNSLLSHDLIEGAYVRAGLVTDIEIIDDYPSHYSAHTRRKHRWLRGDWQIAQWIFGRVPDEDNHPVENPISTISRWKILDNLRRSLMEPVTFALLICGWFFLTGGPVYWTVATIILLLLPNFVQVGFGLGRAILKFSIPTARDAIAAFGASCGLTLLNLIFLPHHMMLSLDAIIRSLNRKFVSGKHMLEWETAAESESGKKKTHLDLYLRLSPVLAIGFAAVLFFGHRRALIPAAPILILWAIAPLVSRWLNSSPRRAEHPLTSADITFLRRQALFLWRYFSEFGDEKNSWLIPDNVEEKDTLQVLKLSPTNLGMLFNARQAAYEFGFITLPEYVRASLGTLGTYDRLEKNHGHIYNWYDIETLRAIPPFTVSAVDSGNLAAGLYTLHAGATDLLKRPILSPASFAGIHLMQDWIAKSNSRKEPKPGDHLSLRALTAELFATPAPISSASSETAWITEEYNRRVSALRAYIESYAPWRLPEFEPLFESPSMATEIDSKSPPLEIAAAYAQTIRAKLDEASCNIAPGSSLGALCVKLTALIAAADQNLRALHSDILAVATQSQAHAEAMEYGFLLVEDRQLLSIGYDGPTAKLHSACYDLLASEARIASFLAVAKGDIPQQSWFRLDRSHVLVKGRACLMSWTGTMFEYMMPALWMKTFPNTLIYRSLEAAVHIQRDHVRKLRGNVPWGISESGFAKIDSGGRYGYQAWGIPSLALKYGAEDGPVIAPYATYLALPILRGEAISNLRRMDTLGWTGAYGLYEAADYTAGNSPELVRSWMAHHQGMSLLALTNLLCDNIFQRWFHANPRVKASELLLHEKALSKDTLKSLKERQVVES